MEDWWLGEWVAESDSDGESFASLSPGRSEVVGLTCIHELGELV